MSTCSEFMVGDWLQDENQFPMQVRIVGEDYLYADFEGNEGDMWEFDDKIEPPYPIPLTEEILKKNGFILCSCNYWELRRESSEKNKEVCEIDVSFERHLIEGFHSINGKSNSFILKNIGMNVHELQQALRLAGLKEMADNFKI